MLLFPEAAIEATGSSSGNGTGEKEGKFLFPLPLGVYHYNPNQPLPLGSLFLVGALIVIPFIPFGSLEFTFALGWDANYIALRLNGSV